LENSPTESIPFGLTYSEDKDPLLFNSENAETIKDSPNIIRSVVSGAFSLIGSILGFIGSTIGFIFRIVWIIIQNIWLIKTIWIIAMVVLNLLVIACSFQAFTR
jgi:hypothetical protein